MDSHYSVNWRVTKKMKELTMQSDLSDFFLINKRIKLYKMRKTVETAEGDFIEFKTSRN